MKLNLFAAVLTLPLMVGCGHQVARIDAEVTSRVTLAGSMRAERSLAIQTNGQRRTIRGDGWHWSVTPWIVGFGGTFSNTGDQSICIEFPNGAIEVSGHQLVHPWPTTGVTFLENGRMRIIGKTSGDGPIVALEQRCVSPGQCLTHGNYFNTRLVSGEETLFGERDTLATSAVGRKLIVTLPLRLGNERQLVQIDFTPTTVRFETAYW
jgi:hypothetical protein